MVEKKEKTEEIKYEKSQIISSKRFENYRDLINAMWTDDSLIKSTEEVDVMIDEYMKGKVE